MDPHDLLEFFRQHRLAVQASVSASLGPQAAVVGFAITDRFEIIFDTVESTRKIHNLRRNPTLALAIGVLVAVDERTVQYEGIAEDEWPRCNLHTDRLVGIV